MNQRLTPPFLGHNRFLSGSASCGTFCIDLETDVSDNFNSTVLTQFWDHNTTPLLHLEAQERECRVKVLHRYIESTCVS